MGRRRSRIGSSGLRRGIPGRAWRIDSWWRRKGILRQEQDAVVQKREK